MNTTLPTDTETRKEYAIGRGCLAYFPAAIAGVARHSFKAGAKYTHGELVHKRWLAGDHEDCIERHLMDLRDLLAKLERDPQVQPITHEMILAEANALAWRALALSQELHERFGGAPLAPAARLQPSEEIAGDPEPKTTRVTEPKAASCCSWCLARIGVDAHALQCPGR